LYTTSSYLKTPSIHLYKVKAHAAILGNECADAIAKCSAEIKSRCMAMISTLIPTPIPIHPSSGQQGLKTLPQLAYQILQTPANEGLQQKGSPFNQISML
jgi:hypothetical protein